MIAGTRIIDVDQALDGARILHRHCLSNKPPLEGWVREFSRDGRYVRISKTNRLSDAGIWHDCYTLKVEAVLEAGRAPKVTERKGPIPNPAPGGDLDEEVAP